MDISYKVDTSSLDSSEAELHEYRLMKAISGSSPLTDEEAINLYENRSLKISNVLHAKRITANLNINQIRYTEKLCIKHDYGFPILSIYVSENTKASFNKAISEVEEGKVKYLLQSTFLRNSYMD